MEAECSLELPVIIFAANTTQQALNKCAINSHSARCAHLKRRQSEKKQHTPGDPKGSHIVRHRDYPEELKHQWTPSVSDLCPNTLDPFMTTAVNIDNEIRYVLLANRDWLLSFAARQYSTQHKVRGRNYTTWFTKQATTALNDESTAYGCIALYASRARFITSNHPMNASALAYRTLAMAGLQRNLGSGIVGKEEATCTTVYLLYTAELTAQEYSSAAFHARFLRSILQPPKPSQRSFNPNPGLIRGILWQDIHRAVFTYTRPILDLERWEEDFLPRSCLQSIKRNCRSLVGEHLLPQPSDLQIDYPALQDNRTRETLEEIRYYSKIAGVLSSISSVKAVKLLNDMCSRELIMVGHLLNEQLDWERDASDGVLVCSPRLYEDRIACICVMFWIRTMLQYERQALDRKMLGQYSKHLASKTMLSRIKDYFVATANDASINISAPSSRFRLWCLYVGAIAEQDLVEAENVWFDDYHNIEFVRHAKMMGIPDWSTVRDILTGFTYFEPIAPYAEFWFARFNATGSVVMEGGCGYTQCAQSDGIRATQKEEEDMSFLSARPDERHIYFRLGILDF
ncbi:hypothetical protein EDD36DRAFT_480595 [Exophiala viscosa]|uniref:Transcription factor domain-containing protein n=1 Tax=Exophiala viscosa TaxID=2486360 RepID=A0AAN6E8I1_9EURO|nr:hypothetical protein EDD36DRAFT_480595 [Exophiala viscosa]